MTKCPKLNITKIRIFLPLYFSDFGYCFVIRASDFEFLDRKTEFSVKR